jgi:hypothetical protein
MPAAHAMVLNEAAGAGFGEFKFRNISLLIYRI